MNLHLRKLASAAATLLGVCVAPVTSACSIISDRDIPFSYDHYVFYGQVVDYTSTTLCGYDQKPGECPLSWGIRLKILHPVHVPGHGITEVEYFQFGLGSACDDEPLEKSWVMKSFPLGTRLALAASQYLAGEPDSRRIRLTKLNPPIGEALAVLAEGADIRKLAAMEFDYHQHSNTSDRDFELWRDRLRLRATRTEREALEVLVRMAAGNDLGMFTKDDQYSAIERLVDQYLPTPSVRVEFAQRLRDARYDAGAMEQTEKRLFALERAQRGDARAMYDFAMLTGSLTRDHKDRDLAAALEWMRRSAKAGFLPAVIGFAEIADDAARDVPSIALQTDELKREFEDFLKAAEARAPAAAKRGDPTAYLFLADLYSERAGDASGQGEGSEAERHRAKAEHFSCLLAKHPDGGYWRDFSLTGSRYVECPAN